MEARVFADDREVWYGGQKMEQLPRLRGRTNYRIDYRHIIDWLVRKPGAFAGYRYREHLFPSSRFRMVYDLLQATMPGRCDRRDLQILEIAAKQGQAQVEDALKGSARKRARATDDPGSGDVPAVPEALRAGAGDGRCHQQLMAVNIVRREK